MDCGAESATDSSTGVQTMPELCVVSWGSLLMVKILICHFVCFKSHSKKDAHVVEGEVARMFGVSERAPLLGEVHCIGTEAELLECSHSSIGRHLCGITIIPPVPDIVISCFGMIVYLTWDLRCVCSPRSCEHSLMHTKTNIDTFAPSNSGWYAYVCV